MNNMRKLIACTVAAVAMCTLAYSQTSPSLKAKFKLAEGADLRILNDNIWDYSQDTIPPKWKEIGEDPRDFVRAPQFARLVTDYMPDVLTLQEYSSHMHAEFYPRVQDAGYVIAWESKEDWNNTPIFYYPETMELLYVTMPRAGRISRHVEKPTMHRSAHPSSLLREPIGRALQDNASTTA